MYAIVEDGGRQYRVESGQELDLDYREAAPGEKITIESVLAVRGEDGLKLGKPLLEGATVTAEVLGYEQGKKIDVMKYRRRKDSRTHTGHRQLYTRVRIDEISA